MLLSCQTVGSGLVPTVLLHGFLGSGVNLRTLARTAADRDPSRVYFLPDLRGHGSSPPCGEDTDLTAMGNDVLETVRAQGISIPIQLVGHSLGGRVALALARAAPDPVAGVALLDIAPGPISASLSDSGKVLEVLLQAPETAPTRQQLRSFLTSHGLSAPISDWLLMNTSVGPEGCRWRFDREGLGRLHQRVNGEDLWDVVENGRVPVRCIRGDRSRYVSDEDVQRLEHAGVGVETLKNAGHYVHVEALEPLVTWLLQGPSPLSSR